MVANVLNAEIRTLTGKKVKTLREEGKLPAVLYGKDTEPKTIVLDRKETTRLVNSIGSSTLINLVLDGKEHNVLMREIQKDYIKLDILHIDFYAVSMVMAIQATVGLVFEGEPEAFKTLAAYLSYGLEEVEIECLAKDLPSNIIVDISELDDIGSVIQVRDLVVPDGIEILEDPEALVVVVTAERIVEEEEEVEDLDVEPEVIGFEDSEEEVE